MKVSITMQPHLDSDEMGSLKKGINAKERAAEKCMQRGPYKISMLGILLYGRHASRRFCY